MGKKRQGSNLMHYLQRGILRRTFIKAETSFFFKWRQIFKDSFKCLKISGTDTKGIKAVIPVPAEADKRYIDAFCGDTPYEIYKKTVICGWQNRTEGNLNQFLTEFYTAYADFHDTDL